MTIAANTVLETIRRWVRYSRQGRRQRRRQALAQRMLRELPPALRHDIDWDRF